MRCFVTGVAGFVGSHLAERLLADGHEVVGVDSFTDYYPRAIKEKNLTNVRSHKRFTFHQEQLLRLNLPQLLQGIDWIFHQAAQAGVRASWGKEFATYTELNILTTQQLLEAAKTEAVRKSLRSIVFASSSSVYGNAESLPTLETACPQPISPYGVTKLAAEHLMVLYAKEFNLPTVSLRYFTVYGPRQRPDMAFNRLIKGALLGEGFTVFGDGNQTRDFTYIDDIVGANIGSAEALATSALATSAGATMPFGTVMNIGGGSRVSLNEVIGLVENILKKKIDVRYQHSEAGDAKHTSANTELAARFLAYQPKVSLADGLSAEVNWMTGMLSGK